jgi:hypothetical protein
MRPRGLFLTGLAGGWIFLVALAPAFAEDSASISGTVNDAATGAPLAGVCVETTDVSALTDVVGGYLLTGISEGTYSVDFFDCGLAAIEATSVGGVAVAPGEAVEDVDVAVVVRPLEPGSISGFITDERTGAGAETCVNVYTADGVGVGGVPALDGAPGRYRLEGLPPGLYKLEFVDCRLFVYGTEWYRDQLDFDRGDVVEVFGDGPTTGIDAQVGPQVDNGGWISGVGFDSAGQPLVGFCATTYALDGGTYYGAPIGEDGSYRIGWLGTNEYKVKFHDCMEVDTRAVWFGGANRFEEAQVLRTVAGEELVAVDAVLPAEVDGGGWIKGIVQDGSGNGIPGYCIDVHNAAGAVVRAGLPTHHIDGRFRIGFLGSGEFRLGARVCGAQSGPTHWYGGASTLDDATEVSVTVGEEVEWIVISTVDAQPVTTTTVPTQAPSGGTGSLPFTGTPANVIAALAVTLLSGGAAVLAAARRLVSPGSSRRPTADGRRPD